MSEYEKIKFFDRNNLRERRSNGLFLSNNEIKILKEYKIDYTKCKNERELLLNIEKSFNEYDNDCDDLEEILLNLSEYIYYNQTKK